MKQLFLVVALLALTMTTRAQESFLKKDIVGHVGVGVGSYLGDASWRLLVPPIVLSGEYGILDSFIRGKAAIGVGGYFAYAMDKIKNDGPSRSHVILGARGIFHYEFVYRLDTYAGLSLTYENLSVSNNSTSTYDSHSLRLFPTIFIGARYYFSNRFAAFAEVGYGISPLEIGVAIKF
ncbi:MAG: hypothetical protein LBD64_08565 [Odoribacteraceae bacterium]|jgi:hypothetical protein|nr:hypothetical protein [Odoribacteraceae bacterium]